MKPLEKGAETGKTPSMRYRVIQRLNELMDAGGKRSVAKAEARARGESLFAFTDQRIHAFETRANYQRIIMRFITWCSECQQVRVWEEIEERANDLASMYLYERIEAGYSAWTLQTERSALRMFYQNRHLASTVPVPTRKRAHIVRSRREAVRDRHFQPEHWQPVIQFCLACGLRREELRDLCVRDIYRQPADQRLVVCVRQGKGGRRREVPVFPGREAAVLEVIAGRDPEARVFERLPVHMDIQHYRRRFARELYTLLARWPLPDAGGPLRREMLDAEVLLYVSRCLGHNRIDVLISHYLQE